MDEIPSVLACDVGNSAIHFANIKGEAVSQVQTFRLPVRRSHSVAETSEHQQLGEAGGDLSGLGAALANLWAQMPPPKKLVACSVNPAGLKALEAAAAEAISQSVLAVGRDLPLPIDTNLAEPSAIGTDRLCAAAAAFDQLGVACVIADFGTAITIDCVNDKGVFQGGAILPGLEMSAHGLKAGTAQLPEVKLSSPDWIFGRNTHEAIVSGVVIGARGALRELVEAYATELGHWPVVILTGSDAALVCGDVNESGLAQAIVPDLVIRGVAVAYYRSLLK